MTTASKDLTTVFKNQLQDYKQLIDEDIASYCKEVVAGTGEEFGDLSGDTMGVFCDVLSRGGKRIRGALTMFAYEMHGGKDMDVALRAARIMEIVQTYLLVVDDVFDRSKTRRGKPSAHVMHQAIHSTKSWKDDSLHFGESMAFNSSLVGLHVAMQMTAKLPIKPSVVLKALEVLNTNLQITCEGQANDIFNEVIETSDRARIENVLIWKTAYYTFVNPLQFGAILASADAKALTNLKEYSLQAGRTFQITDDILGTFGSEFDSGKSPMDDLREGKRTLLTYYALNHADKDDAYYLNSMLGNQDLTQAQFKKCKEIIYNSGAYEFALSEAKHSAHEASTLVSKHWKSDSPTGQFLTGLVEFLITRKS